MTRRRDLFGYLLGYALSMSVYFLLVHFALSTPITTEENTLTIYTSLIIQTLILLISTYYVWRANITKTKEIPEHLIDFPDSLIYGLSIPTFFIIFQTMTHMEILTSTMDMTISVVSIIPLILALCFSSPIMVEGMALFASSKYTKIKKRKS